MKHKIYNEDGNVEGYLNTDSAEFMAADGVLNRDGCTRNAVLYMTPRSKRFFVLNQSMWQGEGSSVEEIEKTEAIKFITQYADIEDTNTILESLGAEMIQDIE